MAPEHPGYGLYVALGLAAAAAVLSSSQHAAKISDKVEWLLLVGAAPDAIAAAGAVNDAQEFPVSP